MEVDPISMSEGENIHWIRGVFSPPFGVKSFSSQIWDKMGVGVGLMGNYTYTLPY